MTENGCSVCMKPALGFHYQVPACHGCKSFFRRTILQKAVHRKCIRDRKCYSNVSTFSWPLKCRECRFQKCVDVGMIAHFGTLRREQSNIPQVKNVTLQMDKIDLVTSVGTLINCLSHLDKILVKVRHSQFDMLVYPSLDDIIQSPSQLGYASKFEPMSGWPLKQSEYLEKQRQLTKLKILHENGQLIEEPDVQINTKEWLPFDMILAIEYTKTFPFFTKLSFSDKLCLIKGTSYLARTLTLAFFSYNGKMDTLHTPDGICLTEQSIKSMIAFHTTANVKTLSIKQLHRKFVLRLLEPLVRDKFTYPEYLLLKAIIVSNPVLDLSQEGQKIVQDERNKYARALMDLCLLNYGKDHGPSRLLTVISYISVLQQHQNDIREFLTMSQLFTTMLTSKSRKKLENDVLCINL